MGWTKEQLKNHPKRDALLGIAPAATSRRKERGTRVCKNCQTEFQVHTSARDAEFCSQSCAAACTGKRTIAENRQQKPKTTYRERNCARCNRPFMSWDCADRVYCSYLCANAVNQPLATAAASSNPISAYSRAKRGWREIGGKRLHFRSAWEANYARYLEFLRKAGEILSWDYEIETFWFEEIRRGTRSYLPDFKVVKTNGAVEYHEVKGWMDEKSKTKLKRMKKYHPNINIILRDSTWFKVNSPQLRGMIKDWEMPSR